MNYDTWKTTDTRDAAPEDRPRPQGWCPTCRKHFDEYDVTLEPYCSARCRAEGEQRDSRA